MRTRSGLAVLLLLAGCGVADGGRASSSSSSPAEAAATAHLERATGAKWTVVMHAELGTPEHLSAPRGWTPTASARIADGASAAQATIAFLSEHRALFGIADAAAELEVVREERDELGMTHARMRQLARGVPVMGGEVYAHFDARGALASLDARWVPGAALASVATAPALDADAAIARATADLARTMPTTFRSAPTARLVVFASGAPRLAYHVRLRVGGGVVANMEYAIDAVTGDVLEAYDDIQTVTGSGVGVLGDTKTLQISASGAGYQLVDTSRTPNGIATYDAANGQNTPGTIYTSTTTSGWDRQSAAPGAAVDAHYYAGLVYDYYKTAHARLGIDGNNGQIVSSVHFQSQYDNAFWDGTQMSYGDGDGTRFRAFSASLDVVGHELSHGVTQNTSGLVYQQQSGALNEAVSDIFGTFVEHAFKPDPVKNWQLGEDLSLTGKPFRDMIHPANGQQPAHMSQLVTTTQDNGGVHTNSGIVNNAMYLMTMGGTNDVSHTQVQRGLGWDQSAKLWYRSAFHYFTSSTNFAGAARATLTAAGDLAFSQDETAIVECAWIATGVLTGTCKPLGTAPPPAQADGGAPPEPQSDAGTTPPATPPGGGDPDSGATDPGSPASSTSDAGTANKAGGRQWSFSGADANACSVHAIGGGDAGAAAFVLLGAAAVAARRRRMARPGRSE